MAKPKFIFDENVEIVKGFYKGQKGKVKKLVFFGTLYKVWCHNFPEGSEFFVFDELRSLDFPNKEFHEKLMKEIK